MIATKRGVSTPDGLALNPEQIASQIVHLEKQRSEIDDAIGELRATHNRLLVGR